MDAIRKGTQLKVNERKFNFCLFLFMYLTLSEQKVDTTALSTGSGDSRSDLMKDIRQGTVLKPAKERELGSQRNSDSGAGTDALADALRRALAARGNAIHSDEDETESSDNEGEWD